MPGFVVFDINISVYTIERKVHGSIFMKFTPEFEWDPYLSQMSTPRSMFVTFSNYLAFLSGIIFAKNFIIFYVLNLNAT